MKRRSIGPRNASRFSPRLEGLEARVVLSAATTPAATAPRLQRPPGPAVVATAAAETSDDVEFPIRMRRFTALFQGSYTVGRSHAQGFATQLYMKGGGNTSLFLHGDVQIAYHVPEDPNQATVGRANVIPKSASDSGDQLLLDFQAVPGAVDKGGRPNLFTWTVSSSSGGQFGDGVGSGTLQLLYFPSRKLPRGAIGAGRLGVVIRGDVGVDDISGLIW